MDSPRPHSPIAHQLERDGFIHVPGVLTQPLMGSLRLRAHATLFRESAEARDEVKSNGSLIPLADNPEYADIVGSAAITLLLRDCGATDPRWTGGFLISQPRRGPPPCWDPPWRGLGGASPFTP